MKQGRRLGHENGVEAYIRQGFGAASRKTAAEPVAGSQYVAGPHPQVKPPAAGQGWKDRLFYRAFTVPALLVATGTAIVPLAFLLYWSHIDQQTGEATFRYYAQALASPFFMRTLLTTIAMAVGVTGVSVALALPMAYVLARHTLLRNILVPVISVPRMLPFVVVGYAMVLLLAPYTGFANKVLMDAGILSEPLFMLFDWPGQALAFGYAGTVVAIAILTGVFMTVDPQLEDAAVTLGAGRLAAFLTVSLPLVLPGIVAASALIFSTIVTGYAIPVMLTAVPPTWSRFSYTTISTRCRSVISPMRRRSSSLCSRSA